MHWQWTSCSQTATISKNFISLYSNTNKFVWYGNFIIRFLGRPWTVHWQRTSCSQTATISKNFISLYSNTNKFVCYGNFIIRFLNCPRAFLACRLGCNIEKCHNHTIGTVSKLSFIFIAYSLVHQYIACSEIV